MHIRLLATRSVIREDDNRVDRQLKLFIEAGKVAKQPPSEIDLRLSLILHVNKKEQVLPNEFSSDQQVGLVALAGSDIS